MVLDDDKPRGEKRSRRWHNYPADVFQKRSSSLAGVAVTKGRVGGGGAAQLGGPIIAPTDGDIYPKRRVSRAGRSRRLEVDKIHSVIRGSLEWCK